MVNGFASPRSAYNGISGNSPLPDIAILTMRLPVIAIACLPTLGMAADWPEIRGPRRDGTSLEKNLPTRWSPAGESLAWKAPFGGRSTPVILGGRLYALNPSGKGDTLQERVVCLEAATGKLVWEYEYNVYLSDVPPHRIAWSSPAADPETGNIYVYGVGGTLLALNRDGKRLWERSLGEEVGLVTTHGGRTVSPVVDGELVIVSGINSGWGETARAAHRFFAYDKRTGEPVWVSTPGGRPFDTTYSPPIITEINGVRLLIGGAGDGTVHALKVATGEPVWKFVMSKRGVNTGPVALNNLVFVSHSEENLDTSEMGLLAALDGTALGEITAAQVKWKLPGFQGGFSSPVVDGALLYQLDNSSNVYAFDAAGGQQLWKKNLGTLQKASPVLGDGKLYVGNEKGRFFILKPSRDGAEVLSQAQLGTEAEPEEIIASAAIANGLVYVVSSQNLYAFGKWVKPAATARPKPRQAPASAKAGKLAWVQVVPADLVLKPGQQGQFRARLFDEKGNFLRESKAAWSAEGLPGAVSADGRYSADTAASAGLVKAAVDGIVGTATVRIAPALPIAHDFEALKPGPPPRDWVNATGKFQVRELEGNRILVKLADNPFTKRARAFVGSSDLHDYTVEARVMATEQRRQMGDAGIVAQRYQLTLFGNQQRLELQPWQPETARTARLNFNWKANTWYRLKLRVENLPGGSVRALGKAWPASEAEPEAWSIDHTDPIGNREGSPGLYADAPFEVFFDDLKVTRNQ